MCIRDRLLVEGEENNRRGYNKRFKLLPGLVKWNTKEGTILIRKLIPGQLKFGKREKIGIAHLILDEEDLQKYDNQGYTVNTLVQGTGRQGTIEEEWTREKLEKEITFMEELTQEQRKEIIEVLHRQKNVFSKSDSDVTTTSMTPYRIRLHDYTPIYQRARRFDQRTNEEIEKQVQELCLKDIVEPCAAEWSSPVVPVRKKDGTLRLCIDYRRINKVTEADRFPMANISETIFSCHGVEYYSCLDLVKGYYQMKLEEDSKDFTAFSTVSGQYRFKRLSFGLKNGPAAFQREMQRILTGFSRDKVVVYVDDILLISKGFEEHLILIEQVLQRFCETNVKIKVSKCIWIQKEVKFLGHIIGRTGIRKLPEFMDQVDKLEKPNNVGELRRYLGMINFQRKFIKNCSGVAAPLSALTGGKRKDKIEWTEERIQAFENLKRLMKESVELAFPDFTEGSPKLELYVDASGFGMGAGLCQQQEEEKRVIAYNSHSFDACERRASTIERELLAIRWGIKSFRPFLLGQEFILYTDHRPLVYLHTMKLVDSKLARVLDDLGEYSFQIHYFPGKENIFADTWSRCQRKQEEEIDVINLEALPRGLEVIRVVPGGADSLFLSLQEVLKREQLQKKDHQELRKFLLDVLINNRKMYGLDKQPKSLKYLRTISISGREPIPEILLAASDEFNLKILLHHGTCCSVVYMGPKARKREDLKSIHIQVLGGTHFNPLRDNGTFQMNKDDTIVDELAIEDQEVPSEEENEGFMDSEESEAENLLEHPPEAVSYTHLTLPTS